MVFIHDLLLLTIDWVDFARRKVEQWTDTSDGGDSERAHHLIATMVASGRLVTTRAGQT